MEVEKIITEGSWVIQKKMIFNFLKLLILLKEKKSLILLVEKTIPLQGPKIIKYGLGDPVSSEN